MNQQPEICRKVDGARMMAHLRELERWQKLSGSSDERASLAYVEKTMRSYGFVTRLIEHDAYISLPLRSEVLVDNNSLSSITHSFSRKSRDWMSAPVVYLGTGADSDFAGQDVTGKFVLVEGIAMPQVARRASLAGALGQIHISPHEHLHEMCISPVWGSPSMTKLGQLPTTVVVTVSDKDGRALRDQVKSGYSPSVQIRNDVDTGWRKTPILVADLMPSCDEDDGSPPFAMLSGHHDTWYFGVMDNGAANATMMEVGRLCAQHSRDLRRGLRICFWSGHSHGRYSSSAWYADRNWTELERRCVAHVNIDSTGGKGAHILRNAAAMSELRDVASEAISSETGETYVGSRRTRAGDDSFGGIGIPSMFGPLSEQTSGATSNHTKLGWWWHTPQDTIDKVDETLLIRDTKVVAHAVWKLVSSSILPLNYRTFIDEMLVELKSLSELLADRFSIGEMQEACEGLQNAIETLSAVEPSGREDRINSAIMRLSRGLIPISYTTGDRFDHDPALPVPAWATLHPLRVLAATAPGSDDEKFANVGAIRAYNRALQGLKVAKAELDAAIAELAA